MVFSSLTFLLLFLPLLLLLYFICRSSSWRNSVLLAGSLLFYAWGEPICILAMLVSTLVNYLCALEIQRSASSSRAKAALVLGVGVSLALLGYFKYFAFFSNTLLALFGSGARVTPVRLPVGISFYTFQVLTYTIDVYRSRVPVQKSFARLLLYVSCFPQLIAGPIVQYADVAQQLEVRSTSAADFNSGMQRFCIGLGKKVLLANTCGAALNMLPQGGTGSSLSLLSSWLLAFLYTLQLYFDFSAYSDMAIGLGRVFGFTYRENFDYPYASLSVTEFWRRWHISLGSFFREYVYIPLGGNRCGSAATIRNLLIVWCLTGLWHGAAWNFILWGLYYGILLILERFVLKSLLNRMPRFLRHGLTFLIVMVGWVLFYYTEFPAMKEGLLALIGLGIQGGLLPLTDPSSLAVLKQYSIFPLLALLCSLPVVPAICRHLGSKASSAAAGSVRLVCSLAVLLVSLVFLIGQSYNPFIYFRF